MLIGGLKYCTLLQKLKYGWTLSNANIHNMCLIMSVALV